MASNNENSDIVTGSPSNVEDATDYQSMSGMNPNPMVLLLCFEKFNGEPLPESLLTPRHISTFCIQHSGERPFNLEFLNSYEVCVTFSEEVVVSLVAGRLMNVSLWHDLNIVVSCTIIPRERVDNIVAARENVRGSWNEHME